jgi:hypothetical protein
MGAKIEEGNTDQAQYVFSKANCVANCAGVDIDNSVAVQAKKYAQFEFVRSLTLATLIIGTDVVSNRGSSTLSPSSPVESDNTTCSL